MKSKLFIIIGVALVLILAVLVGGELLKQSAGPADGGPAPTGTEFPFSEELPASDTFELPARDGGMVTVPNFGNDPEAAQDPRNPGYTYLGYHPFPKGDIPEPTTAPYTIAFINQTRFFNVTLLKEPIGATRKEAEEYLGAKLGLSNEEMCRLTYAVAVPNWVSPTYSGTDLKFSFCDDAVTLPE